MGQNPFLTAPLKMVLAGTIIILTGLLLIVVGNPFDRISTPSPTPNKVVDKIEISTDRKSILNADTKEVVLTIEGAKAYLESFGYAYNPDTFQDTNAKYEGDCFLAAALSSKKDRIVFSTGCLSGDLPQAWIGIDNINQISTDKNDRFCGFNSKNEKSVLISKANACINFTVKFLIGGSGRNFLWSQDDKRITYEADLGLSGLIETRTIDSGTGEIVNKTPSENADWKIYTNEKYGFQIVLLDSWKGYSVLENIWNGITLDKSQTKYQGPEIVIRNPNWREDKLWQDIPIMVFTKDEWALIEAQKLNVSAAPIGPSKLGENEKYIFALPPRWVGFTENQGQDQAQEIVKSFKILQF